MPNHVIGLVRGRVEASDRAHLAEGQVLKAEKGVTDFLLQVFRQALAVKHRVVRDQIRLPDHLDFFAVGQSLGKSPLEDAVGNRRRVDLEQAQERRLADEQAIAELPQLQTSLKAAESDLAELESTRQATTARLGYLDGELQRMQGLRREVSRDTARLASLKEDEGIYQELVTAFGRQGIQAMLIETVVPRLEEEANILLGRMTDNRMQVKLETQRERRSGHGDPIETLEINVSDELGPRSYEMYSGGEAFRINLALRIGLSKVLAQRIGAPLPTLFIDEGFGSQDGPGRERILDVISAIENDFEKIIIVTHLEDMKDVFPVRIEVQKGDQGSSFWIS